MWKKPPPPRISTGKRWLMFLAVHWAGVVIVIVPCFWAIVLLMEPKSGRGCVDEVFGEMFTASQTFPRIAFSAICFHFCRFNNVYLKQQHYCGYTLLVMACYWVSECIPLPITGFLPMVTFPLWSIMPTVEVAQCYFNDTVLMFMGSLMLAASVEHSGLHLRIALSAVRAIGYSHYKLLGAISFTTMFISMWIANTAATTMMVPIVFALLRVFEEITHEDVL